MRGEPVPATVTIRRLGGGGSRGWFWADGNRLHPVRQSPPLLELSASEDGWFEFSGLGPGVYELTAFHGQAKAHEFEWIDLDGATEELILRLAVDRWATSLRGRVKDIDGSPYVGDVAVVRYGVQYEYCDGWWGKTDLHGSFHIGGLPPERVFVIALRPGRMRVRGAPIVLPNANEYELRLADHLRPLTVKVTDGNKDEPLEQAMVTVSADDWVADADAVTAGMTGADGLVTIQATRKDRVVRVSASGFPKSAIRVDAEQDRLEVSLCRGATVRVVAKEKSTGSPAAGAMAILLVEAPARDFPTTYRQQTDEHGVAEFRAMRPGEALIYVGGGGWRSPEVHQAYAVRNEDGRSQRISGVVPTLIPRRGTLVVERQVQRTASIFGRVIGVDGTPVIGATVTANQWRSSDWWRRYSLTGGDAVTDEAGRFRITDLCPVRPFEMKVHAPGCAPPDVPKTMAGTGREVIIKIPPSRYVNVYVREAGSGRPLQDVGLNGDVRTDSRGYARVGPVRPGEVSIHVRPPDHLPPEPVTADTTKGDVSVEIDVQRGESLAIHVRLPDGSSPEHGMYYAGGRNHYFGAGGRFTIHGLPPGPFRLTVRGYQDGRKFSEQREVLVGADLVEFELHLSDREPSAIEQTVPATGHVIRVLGPDGHPVAHASLECSGWDWSRHEVAGGRISVSDPIAGVRLLVTAARDASGQAVGAGAVLVDVPDDVGQEFSITMPTELPISGRVTSLDGSGVAGVRVQAECALEGYHAAVHGKTITDDSGSFRIGGTGALPYRLVVEPPRPYLPHDALPVVGGRSDITITLDEGVVPVFTVLDPDGKPVADAEITLAWGEWNGLYTGTDASGRAVLAPIQPDFRGRLTVKPSFWDDDRLQAYSRDWVATSETRITLRSANSISGQLVDWDGRPVAAPIWYRPAEGMGDRLADLTGSHWQTTYSDETGRFLIDGLGRGQMFLLAGNHHTQRCVPYLSEARRALGVRVEPGKSGLRLELNRKSSIVLQIAGFEHDGDFYESPVQMRAAGRFSIHEGRTHRNRESFLFSGLDPAKKYSVLVRQKVRQLVGTLDGLLPGTDATTKMVRGRTLTGRLSGEYDGPVGVGFAWGVWCVSGDVKTDGTFRIDCLPDVSGTVLVWDRGDGNRFSGRAVARTGTDVTVAVTRNPK